MLSMTATESARRPCRLQLVILWSDCWLATGFLLFIRMKSLEGPAHPGCQHVGISPSSFEQPVSSWTMVSRLRLGFLPEENFRGLVTHLFMGQMCYSTRQSSDETRRSYHLLLMESYVQIWWMANATTQHCWHCMLWQLIRWRVLLHLCPVVWHQYL